MIVEFARFIDFLFFIYQWLIIIYIIFSWFPKLAVSKVGEIIGKLVEPYLAPFRRLIPQVGMVDFSPIIALFALIFIKYGVLWILGLFI